MSVPRPGEVTPDRVRAFAGEIGGIGFLAGVGVGWLWFDAPHPELELYGYSALVVGLILFGAFRVRRWPPARFFLTIARGNFRRPSVLRAA